LSPDQWEEVLSGPLDGGPLDALPEIAWAELGADVVGMMQVCFDPRSQPRYHLDPQTLYKCRHYRPRVINQIKRTRLILEECRDDVLLDNLNTVNHCIRKDLKTLGIEGSFTFTDTKVTLHVEEDRLFEKSGSLLHVWFTEDLPYSIEVTFDELFFGAQLMKKRKT